MKKLIERLNALRTAIADGIEAHKSETGVHDWTKVGTVASFTVPETDGAKEWAKAADATLDFSKMENDAERTTAATGLYDLYDAAKTEVERLQEEEREAAKAASDLRDRKLSALTAVDAPAIITRTADSREFDWKKAMARVQRGEKGVPIPHQHFLREKSTFRTLGGEMVERTKADLDFPAQFAIAENAPGTHFKPTLIDFLRTIMTSQSAYPIRTANSASAANVGVRAGTGLPEAALHADINGNVLQITGAISPVDWHEKFTPGAIPWAMEELAMAARADADKKLVQGTGEFNGFGDITFAAGLKTTVAHQGSVLDGLIAAAAQVGEAYGMWPDALLIAPTSLARAQSESNANSTYLAKASPEMNTDMLWNMAAIMSNHPAAAGTGNAATRKAYVFHSAAFAVAMHDSGFVMETGYNDDDFRQVKESIRAYCACQLIRRNLNAIAEVTITGTA